jgi:glycosyltransferase involved in cell wall biosynthesis
MSRGIPRATVGLVVPAFDKGGLEQVVLNLYRGYRQRGFDCIVFVEGNSAGYMARRLDDADDVFVFNGQESDFLRGCLDKKVDILHYHYSIFHLPEMKLLGFYVLYTLHNVYTWLNDDQFRERVAVIANADRVIAVSSFVREYFVDRAKLPNLRVDVIPNGIETSELTPKAQLTRRELDLPEGATIFVNVASTHRAKHQPALIGAAEILMKSRRDFYVAMIGNASDPGYNAEIRSMLADSPARTHVGLRPFVSMDKLHALYTDVADCLVMASLQEGCANVVLEALATGCPMILTDVGNAREAAKLDDSVVIVPRAYAELSKVTQERFMKLSRTKNTPNISALVAAMNATIERKPARPSPAQLEARREAVDAQKMISAYVSVLEELAEASPA